MKATGCGLGGRVRKLGRTWPAIMLLALAIECSSAYADDLKPNFVFVDGAAATLSPDGSNAFKFDTPVKNSGGKEGVASVKLLSDKDKGCDPPAKVVDPKTTIRLSPNAVEITHFEIKNVKLPATCYIELVTEGEGGNTSLKQIKLTQQYVTSTVLAALCWCIVISGVCALVAWGWAEIDLGKKICLNFKLGSPAWEFAKGWTSTTTLVGAIISTALTLSALPELPKYASKSGYSTLALLISLAVIIAPFVFIVFRTGEPRSDGQKPETYAVVYQGCLWSFLLSCAITLFAGLAQLVVLFLLLHEIFQEYRFWSFSPDHAPWSCNAGFIVTLALGVALCWYVLYSMRLTVKLQSKAADGAQGRLPTWPVL